MKRLAVCCLLLLSVCGCAQMTAQQASEKYVFDILIDSEKIILGTEDTRKEDVETIAKGLASNLKEEFDWGSANPGREAITVNIDLKYYSVMFKRIPPKRHWITYKVKITDNKTSKVIGYETFEDGQAALTDQIEEMTRNISDFILSTI